MAEEARVDWREVLMPVIESMECGDDCIHGRHCITNQFGLVENLVDVIQAQLGRPDA